MATSSKRYSSIVCLLAGAAVAGLFVSACNKNEPDEESPALGITVVGTEQPEPRGPDAGEGRPASTKFTRPMPVPEVLQPVSRAGDVVNYVLRAQTGTTSFFPGTSSETFGYNGSLLGPTLRLRRGEHVAVQIHNELNPKDTEGRGKTTNIHWHGMKIPAAADGPHHDIVSGGTFESRFDIVQRAATLWYHPHSQDSGWQVFKGLAGFVYVEDAESDALAIPHDYGVDDFPLIVQDKHFRADGTLFRNTAGATYEEVGERVLGERILVNGVVNPFLELPRGLVRLRLLNGSDARRYNFAFEDGRTFHVIASDGGFLEKPAPTTRLLLSPAERAEILVDLSKDSASSRVKLISRPFPAWLEETGPFVQPLRVLVNRKQFEVVAPNANGREFPVMELRPTRAGTARSLPGHLVDVGAIPASASQNSRTFVLEEDGGENTINGLSFDVNRVDFTVRPGTTEVWSVTNDAPQFAHSFHVHGVQFNVLGRSMNGVDRPLRPHESGWKDTVLLYPSETVRLIVRFDNVEGMYMFHCHVLSHEEKGMMGSLLVTNDPAASAASGGHADHREQR